VKRISELDGVRGMAISMVVIWHYFSGPMSALGTSSPVIILLAKSTSWFWSGVDLFFVLSGFLIGGIIIDNRDSKNFLSVFYTRRALRILPVYFFFLAAFFALRPSLEQARYTWLLAGNMPDWSYLTFTQNILMAIRDNSGGSFLNVTWSLGIEEQFYLIIPFLSLVLPRKYWIPGAVLLAALAPTLRSLFSPFGPRFLLMPCRMDSLLIGALAAGAARSLQIRGYLSQNKWVLRTSLLVLGIPIGFISLMGKAVPGTAPDHTLLAGFYAVLVLIAVFESGNPSVWIFRTSVLRFLGFISYSLYLFHVAVAGILHGLILDRKPSLETGASWIVMLLSLIVSVSVASLSYFVIERNFLRIGRSKSYDNDPERLIASGLDASRPRALRE
jgi:peptidoglycan/LPS O-acetylase OafA/YrhL